jgi:N-acyl-L-homoserine lactone synthetase
MIHHTFKISDLGTAGALFVGFLTLRNRVLIDGLGWTLSNDGHLEMDQYDNPLAVYSVVTTNDTVIAGARMLPCNATWAGATYMLLDAHQGAIEGIPANLMQHYPTDADTWECTRLVVAPELNADDRDTAMKLVVNGLCHHANVMGANRLVSLSPLTLGRWLGRLGFQAQVEGGHFKCHDDGRLYRAFSMKSGQQVSGPLSGAA